MRVYVVKIVFVCLGNICRSPAAEAIFCCLLQKHVGKSCDVESRATGSWHLNHRPDERMVAALHRVGVEVDTQKRSRLLSEHDLMTADYVFVADRDIEETVQEMATKLSKKPQILMMTVYSSVHKNDDVPDPFYGVDADFDRVVSLLQESCESICQLLVAAGEG